MNETKRRLIEEQLQELLADPRVQLMKGFKAHGCKSVYDHCLDVALKAYELDELTGCRCDRQTLLRGALLHDFYLYDWHETRAKVPFFQKHGFSHPAIACENARKYLQVDDAVAEVIRCHMWPLTLRSFPSSREAMIVCLADKYCALRETLRRWR